MKFDNLQLTLLYAIVLTDYHMLERAADLYRTTGQGENPSREDFIAVRELIDILDEEMRKRLEEK